MGAESHLTEDENLRQATIAYHYLDQMIGWIPDWENRFWNYLDTPGLCVFMGGLYVESGLNKDLSPICNKIHEMFGVARKVARGDPLHLPDINKPRVLEIAMIGDWMDQHGILIPGGDRTLDQSISQQRRLRGNQ
jgi:hypothetical protein